MAIFLLILDDINILNMWLPAKFTINYIPKKFNLFYFLYFIFSYFKFTINIYMWPFFANIMYLHLFMLSESLLCESQLSINFSSWLAVKISSETEDPWRNKLLSSAYIIVWNLFEIKGKSLT